jgi:hypothetical protein
VYFLLIQSGEIPVGLVDTEKAFFRIDWINNSSLREAYSFVFAMHLSLAVRLCVGLATP